MPNTDAHFLIAMYSNDNSSFALWAFNPHYNMRALLTFLLNLGLLFNKSNGFTALAR